MFNVPKGLGVAKVLPFPAAAALVLAASVEPNKAASESRERAAALDQAIRTVKQQYPKYFR